MSATTRWFVIPQWSKTVEATNGIIPLNLDTTLDYPMAAVYLEVDVY